VGDYVREVTNPDKVGSGLMRRHVGSTYTVLCLFVLFFFDRATVQTREPIFAYNSSDAVWCKEDPFGDEKCVILKFGGFTLKTPVKLVGIGNYQPKIKCLITPKR